MNSLLDGGATPDFRFNPWTAVFRDPACEASFQRHHLAETRRMTCITMCCGTVFEMAFWLTDVAALGYNDTTRFLLLVRLLLVLTVAAGVVLIVRNPASVRLPPLAATVVEAVAMGIFLVVIWHRPGELHWHALSMIIMLLVIYLFIPNTFVNAAAVGVLSTLAFVDMSVRIGTLTPSDMATMTLALVCVTAFGLMIAYRHQRLARNEFHVQWIERQALLTQRQFVSMLSHEFRTPLAIIDATVQRLGRASARLQPELAPRIGKVRRAVARLITLLDNCLTEDRLAASELTVRPEPVDLREAIRYGYGEHGAQSSPRIRLELPEAPLWAACDRHLFDIALSNLVGNALKYSPQSTPVIIRLLAARQPGMIAVQVEDRGSGVPAAERERIFDKFYRLAGNQRIPGAGLGLHLARELARGHGGDVVLEPGCPGQGAVFTLTLPCTEGAADGGGA